MNTDTPPQPAHGEPWHCESDWMHIRREDTQEIVAAVVLRPTQKNKIEDSSTARRIVSCVNLLAPHLDLSAVEVYSKETMDGVRDALDLFGKIFALQKPAPLGGWNWEQLASQSNTALATLNSPQP